MIVSIICIFSLTFSFISKHKNQIMNKIKFRIKIKKQETIGPHSFGQILKAKDGFFFFLKKKPFFPSFSYLIPRFSFSITKTHFFFFINFSINLM